MCVCVTVVDPFQDLDDVADLVRQLPDDDGLGPDQRAAVTAASANRARHAAALLDALESAGDATFTAFLAVLRDQHRQLYSVLEETRHSLREDGDSAAARERAAVAGDSVRRLLRRYDRAAHDDNVRSPIVTDKEGKVCRKL